MGWDWFALFGIIKMPKVSVIIPVYNREKLLPRAILSVLKQTFQDLELIIVDDCSTDKTRGVIKDFEEKDKRVKSVFLKENSGGPAYPKNAGFPLAKGEYIAYLDSDDEWLPEKLEMQFKLIKLVNFGDSKNLGLVSCNSYVVNEDGGSRSGSDSSSFKIAKPFWGKYEQVVNIGEDGMRLSPFKQIQYQSLRDVFVNPYLYSSNNSGMLFLTEIINIIGPRDELTESFEDTDIVFRIAEAGLKFYFVDKPLFRVYKHEDNFTGSHATFSKKEAIRRGNSLAYLSQKHIFYEKIPKIYSERLRGVGMFYALGGDYNLARKYFRQAIKLNALSFKNYVNLLLSFFGADFYQKLFILKNRFTRNS